MERTEYILCIVVEESLMELLGVMMDQGMSRMTSIGNSDGIGSVDESGLAVVIICGGKDSTSSPS
jgi:predicted transcriptional regulator